MTFGWMKSGPSIVVSSSWKRSVDIRFPFPGCGSGRPRAAEGGEVGEEIVQQAGVDARGTELLRLAPAADADAVPHRGKAAQAEQRVQDLPRRLGDDEVEPRLEPVRRVQPLAEDEV